MKLLFILGAILVLGSSCRRYETCATYADNTDAKPRIENVSVEG